jgi:hypothetical protein
VPGWEADLAEHAGYWKNSASYNVRSCPEFIPDNFSRDPKTLDGEACMALVAAMVEQAKKDYLQDPTQRRSIESFFEGFDSVIRDLRQKAAKRDAEREERLKNARAL